MLSVVISEQGTVRRLHRDLRIRCMNNEKTFSHNNMILLSKTF